jgi:hypothetical protein
MALRQYLIGMALVAGCAGSPPETTAPARPTPATQTAQDEPSSGAAVAVDQPNPEEAPAPGLTPLEAAPVKLTQAQRELFVGSKEDPGTDFLGGVTKAQEGRHYVAGNEKRLDIFKPRIENLGGAFVGVGSDQAYLLIDWAKSELAWLVDYDPVIGDVHACYHAFFLAAHKREEFLRLWSKEGQEDAIRALEQTYAGKDLDGAVAVYKRYRPWIERRLRGLENRFSKLKVASFLTEQGNYDHIRAMVQAGRVRSLVGNLHQVGAVKDVGEVARQLKVPVRIFYVSNAEQYWEAFPPEYKQNLDALFADDKSIVIRTLLTWGKNQDYRYNIQPLANYREWLGRAWFTSVNQMVPKRKKSAKDPPPEVEYTEVDQDPDTSAAARRAEKQASGG